MPARRLVPEPFGPTTTRPSLSGRSEGIYGQYAVTKVREFEGSRASATSGLIERQGFLRPTGLD